VPPVEAEARARTELWAQQAFKEQARLADRLTYVYGLPAPLA